MQYSLLLPCRLARPLVAVTMLVLAGCQASAPVSDVYAPCTAGQPTLRFASFNVLMYRQQEGQLKADLAGAEDPQIQAVAEIIQRTRPDVLLLNEFDYDATGESVRLFQSNYLAQSFNGTQPITYAYTYVLPSNTGVNSGVDLNGDNKISIPEDAQGYGLFPGQYAMALLSRYPIDLPNARSFQTFLWQDMPGNLLPDDYYSAQARSVLRLSSKNHWDVPVTVDGQTIHILAAHPTPPVFDGPEDRNGRRNHDEIRLWADYVSAGKADYLYDDQGKRGGLPTNARFLIMGDYNADPRDGDSRNNAIALLLDHPAVNSTLPPASDGGRVDAAQEGQANLTHQTPPGQDTADMNPERNGNLRIDYALPSEAGMSLRCSGVFWPDPDSPLRYLVGEGYPVVSSDHRMVWIDVTIQ